MSTQISFPTSNAVVTTGWHSPTLAYASDGSYADAAAAGASTTINSDFGTFGFDSSIPVGSTINSITVETKWKVLAAGSGQTLNFQPIGLGTVLSYFGESTTGNVSSKVYTGILRSNLLDASFKVRLSYISGSTSGTGYCDYVKVTVDYTAPVANNQALTATTIATGATVAKGAGKLLTMAITTAAAITSIVGRVGTLTTTAITTTASLIKSRALSLITTAIASTATLIKPITRPVNLITTAIASTATFKRAISLTKSVGLSVVAGVSSGRTKLLTATQTTAAVLVKGAGNLRTLAVTTYTQVIFVRAFVKFFLLNVNSTVTRSASLTKTLLINAFAVGSFSKLLQRTMLTTSNLIPAVVRGIAFTKKTSPINQAVNIDNGINKNISAAIGSIANFVRAINFGWNLNTTTTAGLIRSKLVILIAAITATATLATKQVMARLLSVAIATATTMQRGIAKKITFTFMVSANLIRGISRLLSASSTTTATRANTVVKSFALVVTTGATFVRGIARTAIAQATTTAKVIRGLVARLQATATTGAIIGLGRGRLMIANAITSTASMTKNAAKAFSLVVASTVTRIHSIQKTFIVIISSPVILVKREIALRGMIAAVGSAAALTKLKFISATLSAVSNLTATVSKLRFVPVLLSRTVTLSATFTKALTKTFLAYISSTPALKLPALFLRSLTAGAITCAATLSKPISKLLAVTVTLTTSMRKGITHSFGLVVMVSASFQRAIATRLLIAVNSTPKLARGFYRSLAASVALSVVLSRAYVARIVYAAGRILFSLFRKRSLKP